MCSYQLNRNELEAHILELNRASPNVTFCAPATRMETRLAEGALHQVKFQWEDRSRELQTEWLVDTTGRGQFLKRRNKLAVTSPIQNGSSWCWVDGLVNIEKLTRLSLQEIRTKSDRRQQGMIPLWLATNHFCGEGFWFWVIPLQGITSLGVVYDKALFPEEKVATAEGLIEWACREFPLFQDDLPRRKILDSARLRSYAYDCRQTISEHKWAMSGMSGRFTDPLYSPGSDLISYYNTMIVDATTTPDDRERQEKCALYEPLMRAVYEAYVPSYATSYDALGDQEVFTMKYAWELSVYFSFYVFPFLNDLFTHYDFARCFLRKFALLGPINRNLQQVFSDYYQWKKLEKTPGGKILGDFTELTPLKVAETAFYEVGVTPQEAEDVLDRHLDNLKEFARFILAYICSTVLEDPQVVVNHRFVRRLKLKSFRFDPAEIHRSYEPFSSSSREYPWQLDPLAMEKFRTETRMLVAQTVQMKV